VTVRAIENSSFLRASKMQRIARGDVMSKAQRTAVAAISLIGALATSHARAQSAGADAEIASLKQQLRLMEQKLDKLQKKTAANTAAAATADAKADAKVNVANANPAYPAKGPLAPSDVVVKMPNNRPTICTADDRNCISITSRVHFDAGGHDYRPNTARLFHSGSMTASTSAARVSG
jgi:phosphate-selective porin OprO/OprP